MLNPIDFSSGNPSTSPGTVIIRPVVTDQNGVHVEFSLTCLGCANLTGTPIAPIDKANPSNALWQLPNPQSVYNYNPVNGTAVQSVPLYQGPGVSLACTDCFLALLQAGLYLAVDYNIADGVGFQTIQIEADVTLFANLDLTLTSDGEANSTWADPLVVDLVVFSLPFPVADIAFTATIEANVTAILSFQGSGNMSLSTGIEPAQCLCCFHLHHISF